jgi:predicted nucleotidyltransferase
MTQPPAQSPAPLDRLPKAVRGQLDELRRSLERVLGDDLVGLLVYGSAARGEYREGRSDVDLMLVLKETPRAKLELIASALQLARYSARIEAMVLTAAEIPRAADVFPLLYDDVRREHVLLSGKDPFSDLVISDRHRRLRIEQELREAQIRLRRAIIDAQGSPEMLGGAVFRKLRQIRGPLRALFALRGIDGKDDLAAVLEQAGATYGVDVAPLFGVHEKPARAHEAMEKLLAAAVDDVDRLEVEGATAG